MRVIVFRNSESQAGKRLRGIITDAQPDIPVEYTDTLADLMETLKRPGNGPSILVLQIVDQRTLDELISAGDWLTDFQIILILPDQCPETISKGHLLLPRFLTFANGGLEHVGTVLVRLSSQFRHKLGAIDAA